MPMIIAMTSYKVRFCHDWSTLAVTHWLTVTKLAITFSKLEIICIELELRANITYIDTVIIGLLTNYMLCCDSKQNK